MKIKRSRNEVDIKIVTKKPLPLTLKLHVMKVVNEVNLLSFIQIEVKQNTVIRIHRTVRDTVELQYIFGDGES